MSRQGMEHIIERALVDESFRGALFADPERACVPFNITEREFVELMGRALPETHPYRRQGFAGQAHA